VYSPSNRSSPFSSTARSRAIIVVEGEAFAQMSIGALLVPIAVPMLVIAALQVPIRKMLLDLIKALT
jgi:hypothetical protein